jgi:hypothetical protein
MYEMSYTETECIKIRTISQDTNMHVNSCLYECWKVIYMYIYAAEMVNIEQVNLVETSVEQMTNHAPSSKDTRPC